VIDDVETDGFMTGVVTTNNFHTFFYNRKEEIVLVEPEKKESFVVKDYQSPIPAMLVYAKEEDIEVEFRERAKKRPVVLMVHGGPHGSFLSAHTCLRYTLLKMGYALLMPNFPGSTGYGQEYLNSLVKGIGEKDVKLILELLNVVLTENADFDKSKVHVYGGSYGGYLSALMGSRHSTMFKSAIILNGVLSNGGELWFTDIPEWVTA
jgi:pimeloyl-ACP methyl ester carboxylesterase